MKKRFFRKILVLILALTAAVEAFVFTPFGPAAAYAAPAFTLSLTPDRTSAPAGGEISFSVSLSGTAPSRSGAISVTLGDGLELTSGEITLGGTVISSFDISRRKGVAAFSSEKPFDGQLASFTVRTSDTSPKTVSVTVKLNPSGAEETAEFILNVSSAAPGPGGFCDTEAGAYYADAVAWAVGKGIAKGTGDNAFSPDAVCTRAQAVTFLWRAAGSPAPKAAGDHFDDVGESDYYRYAVLWAVENGITKGTGPSSFSPDSVCTRGQIVTFLWRFAGMPEAGGGTNPFGDVREGDYYFKSVLWAVGAGVTEGTGAERFSPGAPCTRAHIVTFLYRFMK